MGGTTLATNDREREASWRRLENRLRADSDYGTRTADSAAHACKAREVWRDRAGRRDKRARAGLRFLSPDRSLGSTYCEIAEGALAVLDIASICDDATNIFLQVRSRRTDAH